MNVQLRNELEGCITGKMSQALALPGGTATVRVTTAIGAAVSTPFRKAIFKGSLDQATLNSGSVFLGNNAGNGTGFLEILPGEERIIEAPAGANLDLNDWFMQCAVSSDGLLIYYW